MSWSGKKYNDMQCAFKFANKTNYTDLFNAAVVSLRFNNFLFVLKLFLDLKVCIDHLSILFNVVLKVKNT